MAADAPIPPPDDGMFSWARSSAPRELVTILNKLYALEIAFGGKRFVVQYSGENALIDLKETIVTATTGLPPMPPRTVYANPTSVTAVPVATGTPVLTSVTFGASGGFIGGTSGNIVLTTVGSSKNITLGASGAIILGSLVRHQITTTTGAFNNDLVIECLLGGGNIHITSKQTVYLNPANANHVACTLSGNGRLVADNSDSHCIITTTTQTAGKSSYLWLQRNGGPTSLVGVSGAANFLLNGCAVDDLCLQSDGNICIGPATASGKITKVFSSLGLTVLTVATLPSVTPAGQIACVSDAASTLAANIGGTVVGGGANFSPVFSDGTNWKQG